MSIFPAFCVPLPLLASLAASLFACPALAQTHGTFQTTYSGGSVGANIVSTKGGPNTSSNTPQVTPFTAGSGQYVGSVTVSADTDSGGGTNHCTAYIPDPNSANSPILTATLIWKPDPSNPNELPPAALAMQTSNAFWTLLGADGGSTGSGSGLSNGLSNGVVGPNSNNTGQICNSTLYSVWTASAGAATPISFPKTCNPTVNFAGTSGSQEHAAAAGSIGDTYAATAFPIFLAAPNPLGHPELGDGTNQFVYDAETPDGYLAVPASVTVVGASTAGTAFAKPHVALSVSPAMQTGAQTFQWLNSGPSLYVYTPGSYPNGNNYPSAAFIYKGLPKDNTYFGNHVMTMNVDSQAAQTANYQLFFTGTGSNWPNSDGVTPNWYNYYSNVYTPFSAANPAVYGKLSSSSDASSTSSSSPFLVTIKDDAYSTSYDKNSLRVFDINPAFPKYAHFIGVLTLPGGLMQFIHVAAHERGHQALFQMGTDGPIYTNSTNPLDPNSSEDGDIVDDNWEAAHHLNASASDTTHAYANSGANDSGDGDGEFLADVQALAPIFAQLNDWQQDWADGGIQKDTVPFLVPNSKTGVVSGFSLTFTPYSAASNGTITSTGSSQQVKSLNDISAINQSINGYNAGPVISSLSQLGP